MIVIQHGARPLVFSHERLDVYRLAIEFAAWAHPITDALPSNDPTRSQLARASISIPLNIAEGNAKSSKRDRARFWQIALGSTFECAAILDVLVVRSFKTEDEIIDVKKQLERIAAMLIRLLQNLGDRVLE